MIEGLFTQLWNCGCCLCWRWCKRSPNRSSYLVKFTVKMTKEIWKRFGCFLSWKTCSWYWLLESFRRHYEGPLTEVLLKIQWMIEKLIQDNVVVVLRTIHSFCQKIKLVLLCDEVECCASAGSACEEIVNFLVRNWYSSTAMVDKWNASVLSACFGSLLQFNCKLVRYCNIWLSRWIPSLFWPRCISMCGFLTFSFSPLRPLFLVGWFLWNQTLGFPCPREGLVELLLWVFWTLLCSFWR